MKEFEKQAKDFLKKTETIMVIKFSHKGLYSHNDKKERNIYNVTMKNDRGSYSFTFGASIYNTEIGKKPSCYDILSCLGAYSPGTFDNFINDYGYSFETEREYIDIKKIYFNVITEYENLTKLFSSDELELLAEIQ